MYNLNQFVDAIYVQSYPYGSSFGNLKVYIPSLMPSIVMDTPRITPVSLNKSIYLNASDCKPAVGSSINTQNFVTAQASFNSYQLPCYRYGSGLKVMSKTRDCLTCRLYASEEDNSIPDPDAELREDDINAE